MYTRDALSQKIRSLHNCDITKNNVCYIGTNEQNLSNTEKILSTVNISTDVKCHIGFSGYFNFDIAYWRKSNRIILCDVNPNQVKFLKQTLISIYKNDNRNKFVDYMILYFKMKNEESANENEENNYRKGKFETMRFSPNVSDDESYFKHRNEDTKHHDCVSQLYYGLNRKGDWLSSDVSYNYIRKLASNDLISIFCEDVKSKHIFERIKNILSINNIIVDTIYLANILDYMITYGDAEDYNTSVRFLCNSKTFIIESECSLELNQTIVTGRKFLALKY